MIAAAYIRVSSGMQVETGASLPSQLAEIRAYCKKHDLELLEAHIYTDAGKSARTDDRPASHAIIAAARQQLTSFPQRYLQIGGHAMPIIQVPLEVSEDTYKRLLSGEYKRFGSVVRDREGIIEHLKESPTLAQKQESNMLRIVEVLKKHKALIAIGLGVIVAGGAMFFVTGKKEKNKENVISETPKLVENYNASLCVYLEAVRSGNVNINIINHLISDLEDINMNYSSDKIKNNFSIEQLDTLANIVLGYTRKLAEANSIELSELEKTTSASPNNTILNLQRYLKIQEQIFDKTS